MLLLIIILILLFGGGLGYYGHSNWGPSYGFPSGLGAVLIILLVCWLLGLFNR